MAAGLLAALAALRDELAGFDPRELPGGECTRVVEELTRTENACAAARVAACHRAVESGAHQLAGFSDGASWVAHQTGGTAGQARRELEAAERLADCPETQAAFMAGEISPAQAVEITQAEADTPGVEHTLLPVARRGDLSKLKDEAREQRQARTPVEELAAQQRKARKHRQWRDRLGMVRYEGALPPEIGVPFMKRVEKRALQLRQAARREHPDHPSERFEAYMADAFAEILASDGGEIRPAAAEMILICDINAYRRGYAEPGEICKILDGGPITVELARELSKDAFFKGLLFDGTRTLSVKHFGKHIPAELRTAIEVGPAPEFPGRRCVDCGSRWHLDVTTGDVVPVVRGWGDPPMR